MIAESVRYVKSICKRSQNKLISRVYITGEKVKNPYSYTATESIVSDVLKWCKTLPSDFDVVVAIPRSGMLVGSIIATEMGKPLSTPDLFSEGKYWMSTTSGLYKSNHSFYNSILLVDDTILGGTEMAPRKKLIETMRPDVKIITAALYVYTYGDPKNLVDRFYGVRSPSFTSQYGYALMHQKAHSLACDLDGVLCHDYDGSDYTDFIKKITPYRIPTYEIDHIITARLEQHRAVTEEWLRNHNVKYGCLHMRPSPDIDSIAFKTSVLIKEKPYLFWESDPVIAEACSRNTGIKTLCFDNGILYG